jgi:integrase
MRRLAAQAGLPDDLTGHLGPEAMRHSFATLYLDAGGSLSDLQEVMGHADPRTTRRYDRERQAPGRSPGDVVAAYLAAPPHPGR